MLNTRKLDFLQRQVVWHVRFLLTIIEDLEQAARDADRAGACYFVQAFVSSCMTLSHYLWPGGRRFSDRLALGIATELRQRLGVAEDSLLAWERLAPLGIAMQFTQQNCRDDIDLKGLSIRIDGVRHPLRPLMAEIRELGARVGGQAPPRPEPRPEAGPRRRPEPPFERMGEHLRRRLERHPLLAELPGELRVHAHPGGVWVLCEVEGTVLRHGIERPGWHEALHQAQEEGLVEALAMGVRAEYEARLVQRPGGRAG